MGCKKVGLLGMRPGYKKVVPGIEPGLPEDLISESGVMNHYTTQPSVEQRHANCHHEPEAQTDVVRKK